VIYSHKFCWHGNMFMLGWVNQFLADVASMGSHAHSCWVEHNVDVLMNVLWGSIMVLLTFLAY
jgi:hypothetical protein